MSVGSGQATVASGSDSVLDLAGNWSQTEWGVYGDANGNKADFDNPSGTSLEAQTSFVASTGAAAPGCASGGTTGESNNLNLAATTAPGLGDLPTMVSKQTSTAGGTASCAGEPGYQPGPASGLVADGLTGTWQAQSDLGSTGSPQPLPNTTAGCGNWSGGDGTQVVSLGNGENLWSFGDTSSGRRSPGRTSSTTASSRTRWCCKTARPSPLSPAAADAPAASRPRRPPRSPRRAAEALAFIQHRLRKRCGEVLLHGELRPGAAAAGSRGDPAVGPGVREHLLAQAVALNSCTANPIMWGAATVSSGGYYLHLRLAAVQRRRRGRRWSGRQLYLARAVGDPSDQGQLGVLHHQRLFGSRGRPAAG